MKFKVIGIGQTAESDIDTLCQVFEKRLKHYCNLEINFLQVRKKQNKSDAAKEQESTLLLAKLKPSDFVVLLDEKGREYTSMEFANFIQKRMNAVTQEVVFLIGGPYGFSRQVEERANHRLSLSKMTFTHQMVRLFFLEQLYRAFTILKREKYHH